MIPRTTYKLVAGQHQSSGSGQKRVVQGMVLQDEKWVVNPAETVPRKRQQCALLHPPVCYPFDGTSSRLHRLKRQKFFFKSTRF